MADLKYRLRTAMVAGSIMLAADTASAETSVTVDFANKYVFRGVAGENYVVQPSIEAYGLGVPEKYGYITVAMWANYELTDNNETQTSSEFSEIDLYAYYMLPTLIDRWDFYVGYTDYIYPNTEAPEDHEVNFGFGYSAAGIYLSGTAYLGVGGEINGDWYYNFSGTYSLEATTNLELLTGAQIGYYDPDKYPAGWNDASIEIRFTYWLTEAWYIAASASYVILLYDAPEDIEGSSLDVIRTLRIGSYF